MSSKLWVQTFLPLPVVKQAGLVSCERFSQLGEEHLKDVDVLLGTSHCGTITSSCVDYFIWDYNLHLLLDPLLVNEHVSVLDFPAAAPSGPPT